MAPRAWRTPRSSSQRRAPMHARAQRPRERERDARGAAQCSARTIEPTLIGAGFRRPIFACVNAGYREPEPRHDGCSPEPPAITCLVLVPARRPERRLDAPPAPHHPHQPLWRARPLGAGSRRDRLRGGAPPPALLLAVRARPRGSPHPARAAPRHVSAERLRAHRALGVGSSARRSTPRTSAPETKSSASRTSCRRSMPSRGASRSTTGSFAASTPACPTTRGAPRRSRRA